MFVLLSGIPYIENLSCIMWLILSESVDSLIRKGGGRTISMEHKTLSLTFSLSAIKMLFSKLFLIIQCGSRSTTYFVISEPVPGLK